MKTWLLKFLIKELIKEIAVLEPYIADKLTTAQNTLGAIPPAAFANQLVTDIQIFICKKVNINPSDLGIKEN